MRPSTGKVVAVSVLLAALSAELGKEHEVGRMRGTADHLQMAPAAGQDADLSAAPSTAQGIAVMLGLDGLADALWADVALLLGPSLETPEPGVAVDTADVATIALRREAFVRRAERQLAQRTTEM